MLKDNPYTGWGDGRRGGKKNNRENWEIVNFQALFSDVHWEKARGRKCCRRPGVPCPPHRLVADESCFSVDCFRQSEQALLRSPIKIPNGLSKPCSRLAAQARVTWGFPPWAHLAFRSSAGQEWSQPGEVGGAEKWQAWPCLLQEIAREM